MTDIYSEAELTALKNACNAFIKDGGTAVQINDWLTAHGCERVSAIPRILVGTFLRAINSGVSLGGHAVLSASGAARWLACPPSARLEQECDDYISPYANEGTKAHKIAERRLRAAIRQTVYPRDDTCDMEMWEAAGRYVDLCMERLAAAQQDSPDAKILIEERLDFSNYVPKGFGTGDCVIIGDRALEVIDFKYGKGICVDAHSNPQMRLYALGALNEYGMLYDAQTVILTIAQPRMLNYSSETVSVSELTAWGREITPIAQMAYLGEGEQQTGTHCQFCKARGQCRAVAQSYAMCLQHPHDAPLTLTDDELASVVALAGGCKSWLIECEEAAYRKAMGGVKLPGLKLVLGRGRRQFSDTDKARELLLADGYDAADVNKPPQLRPLTDIERLLGKAKFKGLLGDVVVKEQGKPQLVNYEDSREEATAQQIAEAQFAASRKGE